MAAILPARAASSFCQRCGLARPRDQLRKVEVAVGGAVQAEGGVLRLELCGVCRAAMARQEARR